MTRLPNDFELKIASKWWNYFKITEEEQEFRILTSPITWFRYFAKDKDWNTKPRRQKNPFKEVVKDENWNPMKDEDWNFIYTDIPSDSIDWTKPRYFRAFVVWNHNLKQIQIMEITQKTIMKTISDLTKSVDWSDPKQYDFSIVKSWKGIDTKYTLTPLPKSRFTNDEEWNKALEEANSVRLEALYDWDDPFKPF